MRIPLLLLVGSVIFVMPGAAWTTMIPPPLSSETGLFHRYDESGHPDYINYSSDAGWEPEFSTDSALSSVITWSEQVSGDEVSLISDVIGIRWGSVHAGSDIYIYSISKHSFFYSMEAAPEALAELPPEPTAIFLLGIGLIVIACIQRKFAIGKLSRSL